MRGSLGLVIGLVVGAGGMYLALRPPWGHRATTATPIDGGVVAQAPGDAGVAKPKKKKRRPSGTVSAQPGGQGWGSDEEYEETEAPQIVLTAADRALEWRGDDVTLPPTKIDMSGGGEARPLDDSEINNTFNSQGGGLRDCVIKGATGVDLHATITVKMVVDGTGHVSRARVQAPHYMQEHGLPSCVKSAVGRMKFPASGAPTSVSLPITLG